MSRQYLDVPYRSKDAAKALGARFDGTVKRWYVEAGIDLAAFSAWMPTGAATLPALSTVAVAASDTRAGASLSANKGISLSRLLSGVSAAIAQAFAAGVWTLVEVVEARVRNGHVYLELSERDANGQPVAKAQAVIWGSTAARVLPQFEKATGAVIGAGIKLLVRARPVFKAQYGFSLELDAIDSEYTLGDLEARKNEIRARLQQEGVFKRNRQLPAPWDFRYVLVIAPSEAAGLGDFQKEAERLAHFGVCRFTYGHSRFQGEGAAAEIVSAMKAGLSAASGSAGALPDAVAIIRGGGAVNDLAWLNDYVLARFICDLEIPVITGIGHERDSTVPDEVAHTRYDTPSKVIAGIEQQILRRTRDARAAWDSILSTSAHRTHNVRADVEKRYSHISADAMTHLARARQDTAANFHALATGAVQQVHAASRGSLALLSSVRADASEQVAAARQAVPALMTEVRVDALAHTNRAQLGSRIAYNAAIERAAADCQKASENIALGLQRAAERSLGVIQRGRAQSEALAREITGQGPQQTLARGFAIVRSEEGKPIMSHQDIPAAGSLQIQFHDGIVELPSGAPIQRTLK